ncbi:hypothetical protein [Parashewanella curva]|nr:hypothetical protein [Parashewanella curva]
MAAKIEFFDHLSPEIAYQQPNTPASQSQEKLIIEDKTYKLISHSKSCSKSTQTNSAYFSAEPETQASTINLSGSRELVQANDKSIRASQEKAPSSKLYRFCHHKQTKDCFIVTIVAVAISLLLFFAVIGVCFGHGNNSLCNSTNSTW